MVVFCSLSSLCTKFLVRPNEMMNARMAGQTINDRLLAAKHSIAGQGLAKAVCKATTEEMIGPKKKHLDCKTTNRLLSLSTCVCVCE